MHDIDIEPCRFGQLRGREASVLPQPLELVADGVFFFHLFRSSTSQSKSKPPVMAV